jgi:hypothetical protein
LIANLERNWDATRRVSRASPRASEQRGAVP